MTPGTRVRPTCPRPSRLLRRWGGNRRGLSVTPAVWVRPYSAETAETARSDIDVGSSVKSTRLHAALYGDFSTRVLQFWPCGFFWKINGKNDGRPDDFCLEKCPKTKDPLKGIPGEKISSGAVYIRSRSLTLYIHVRCRLYLFLVAAGPKRILDGIRLRAAPATRHGYASSVVRRHGFSCSSSSVLSD